MKRELFPELPSSWSSEDVEKDNDPHKGGQLQSKSVDLQRLSISKTILQQKLSADESGEEAKQILRAKVLVNEAIKKQKVFSICGPFPVVRAALRERGWVEHCLSSKQQTHQGNRHGTGKTKQHEDKLHQLMSQMVQNEKPFLYWTINRINHLLTDDQMSNCYTNANAITTKVGLCESLKNLHWFDDAVDPDTFFPRCYKLSAEDDKQAFIDDFRRTACTSLLQHVVENQQNYVTQHILLNIPSTLIDQALQVCQNFLDSFEHKDIDVPLESAPTLTEKEWSEFLQDYNQAVNFGNYASIMDSHCYVDKCRSMLNSLRKVSPQLDTDGTCNIWIVKPGAMSCGRGIKCKKQLDDILQLGKPKSRIQKKYGWVVQKYIERPFLIHGTKIDLRQWFLVTNWNPLTIWFYKKAYIRFSTQPYSLSCLDRTIHLCNNSLHKHLRPSPQLHPQIPEDSMWCCHQFQDFLASQDKADQWERTVVPGMKRALLGALWAARDEVEPRSMSFELYGADFMLDEELRPWLIEINASPSLNLNTAVKARLCAAVQRDTLRVVLDRSQNSEAHTGDFELMYKQAEVAKCMTTDLFIKGDAINLCPAQSEPVCNVHSTTLTPDSPRELHQQTENKATLENPEPPAPKSDLGPTDQKLHRVTPNNPLASDCNASAQRLQRTRLFEKRTQQLQQVSGTVGQKYLGKANETQGLMPRPSSTLCVGKSDWEEPFSKKYVSWSRRCVSAERRQKFPPMPVNSKQPQTGQKNQTPAFKPTRPVTAGKKTVVQEITFRQNKTVFSCSGSVTRTWGFQTVSTAPERPQQLPQFPVNKLQHHIFKTEQSVALKPRPPGTPSSRTTVRKEVFRKPQTTSASPQKPQQQTHVPIITVNLPSSTLSSSSKPHPPADGCRESMDSFTLIRYLLNSNVTRST